MVGITIYLSKLTLTINGLNSSIKRHYLAKLIKKEDPTFCCLQETHLPNPSRKELEAIHALFFFFHFSFIIHMCIQGLVHFSPLLPPPPLPPTPPPPAPPPQYPAETILPLSLILL
jgi:hypothetical protein